MLFSILPVLTLLLLILLLYHITGWGLRRSLLRALVLVGVYGILSLEILSLFSAVNRFSLIVIWAAPGVAIGFRFWKIRTSGEAIRLPRAAQPRDWFEWGTLAALLIVLLLTGITAWFAPPNTYDSLTYHMSRIAHWAQDGGVKPYATGILRQIYMSPGAEMGILHTYVLSQSDRFANFIQWSAMVLSLVAVSEVARELGAGRKGQLFTALFAATLPMGITQASSTMTDYVVALWVIVAVSETMTLIKGQSGWAAVLAAGTSVGLALVTKQNALPYLIPFALWMVISARRHFAWRKMVAFAAVGILLIIWINAGQFIRNRLVFNSVLGGGSQVSNFLNQAMNVRLFLSNLLRNMSLHVGTPWPEVNEYLYTLVAKVHWKLGVELTDSRISSHPFFRIWRYPSGENRTPNTLHAVLLVITAILALIRPKRIDKTIFTYGLSVLAGFAVLAALFKFTVLGSRYHMTFFLLAAPLVSVIFEKSLGKVLLAVTSIVLVIGAVPLLFYLNQRPLITPGSGRSVLEARRIDQYFVNAPNADEPYFEMTEIIESAGCDRVGIILRGDTPEYLLWVFLDAPRSGIELDWIISKSDPSGKFRRSNFNECAVVCEGCARREGPYNALPLVYDKHGYRLYLRSR